MCINPIRQTCITGKVHIYCIRHTNLSIYLIICISGTRLASCISNQSFTGQLPHMPFCFFCGSMTELRYLPCIFPTALAVKMSLSCWDVPNPHIKLSRENCSKPWGPRIHISDAQEVFLCTWGFVVDHKNIVDPNKQGRVITAVHHIKKSYCNFKMDIYLNSLNKWQQILAIICCKSLSRFCNSVHSVKYPE